jgi:hypothetical protein
MLLLKDRFSSEFIPGVPPALRKDETCNLNHRIAIRALIYVKAAPMGGEGAWIIRKRPPVGGLSHLRRNAMSS